MNGACVVGTGPTPVGNDRVDAEICGVLEDGRRYVMYRTFLNSDGFTPYVGKKERKHGWGVCAASWHASGE